MGRENGVDHMFILNMTLTNRWVGTATSRFLFINVCVASFFLSSLTSPLADQSTRDSIYVKFFQKVKSLVPNLQLPESKNFASYWKYTEGYPYKTTDHSGNFKAPYWTSGFWNEDQRVDFAYILVEEASPSNKYLYAFVSRGEEYEAFRLAGPFQEEMAVATEKRGVCLGGNGISSKEKCFHNQTIAFFHLEGAGWIYGWNVDREEFVRYQTAK